MVFVLAFVVGCVVTFFTFAQAMFATGVNLYTAFTPLFFLLGASAYFAFAHPEEAKAIAIWMALVPVLVFSSFFIEVWGAGHPPSIGPNSNMWWIDIVLTIAFCGGGAWVGQRLGRSAERPHSM
jgi:hypothetical protein